MTLRAVRRSPTGVAVAIAGLFLWPPAADGQAQGGGPTPGAQPAQSTAREGRDRLERVDRTSRTLALGPAGSLELRNFSGNIIVAGGSARDVTIEIVRRSRGRTDTDAALGLQQVQIVVDHRGERASVDVVHTRERERVPYRVSAEFTVTVPAGTRVTARSVSGDVVVKNVTGDVAAETVSGSVDVTGGRQVSKARSVSGNVVVTNVASTRPLIAGSMSGNVRLSHVTASRISAEVMSGDVRVEDVACDSAQMKSLSGSVEYAGRFSAGGHYEFTSHSGSVTIAAVGPVGFELQATSFSGRIRPEGLSLQAMSMNRGSLRGTVGDGSAVVVAQTFSGDVVITRR